MHDEAEPVVIELMMDCYYRQKALKVAALEFRLSPRRFAELRSWVKECMTLYSHASIASDGGYEVMGLPIRIDERLPPSALGLRSA